MRLAQVDDGVGDTYWELSPPVPRDVGDHNYNYTSPAPESPGTNIRERGISYVYTHIDPMDRGKNEASLK